MRLHEILQEDQEIINDLRCRIASIRVARDKAEAKCEHLQGTVNLLRACHDVAEAECKELKTKIAKAEQQRDKALKLAEEVIKLADASDLPYLEHVEVIKHLQERWNEIHNGRL